MITLMSDQTKKELLAVLDERGYEYFSKYIHTLDDMSLFYIEFCAMCAKRNVSIMTDTLKRLTVVVAFEYLKGRTTEKLFEFVRSTNVLLDAVENTHIERQEEIIREMLS